MAKVKKQKDMENPSWREAFSLNLRGVRLLCSRYPGMMASTLIQSTWSALNPYLEIWLSAQLVSEIAGNRDPARIKMWIWLVLISAAAVFLISSLLIRWKNAVTAGQYFKVQRIFDEKMMRLDFPAMDNADTHELLARIEQHQNSGGWGLYHVINNFEVIYRSALSILGGITLTITLFTSHVTDTSMAFLNNPLFLVAVIAVMLGTIYLSPALATRGGNYFSRHANDHLLGNRLWNFYRNLGDRERAEDVRIYRQDRIGKTYYYDKTDTFSSKGIFAKFARGPMGFFYATSEIVSVVFTGFVYLFVCLKAWAGAFGVGAVTQYIGAITRVSGHLSSIIRTCGNARNNAAFLRLAFRFLDLPDVMQTGNLPAPEAEQSIELKDVSFRYPGSDTYALKHVSMVIRPGERLAVVGQNGSGKTTLIKLLCRLYDPTEGEILLNGKNIREYDYTAYLSIFSVVFQDFQMFALPIGQNVAGKAAYDRTRAEECLRQAGFGDRLSELEAGCDTYISKELNKKGVDISGGEAQKIALARALYRDTPFIILDEPTAALDPIAEAEVYERFDALVQSKTAVYISHRLSSCRFCDDIAVFHQGELVQRGGHEELLAQKDGKYRELWNAQAQYYSDPA